MGYEIDFLKVGEEGTSGDAIPLRYGNLYGDRSAQRVVVIDGGFKETGPDVVKFVQERYRTSVVDLAVSTHPDRDHAPGLAVVLEELEVHGLWMHKPWEHAAEVCGLLNDGRSTPESVRRRLCEEFPHAVELEEIAERKGIPVEKPFQGLQSGDAVLTILGPTRSYYVALVGPVLAEGESIDKSAFISAAKDGAPTHPSGRVINAFVRRGARVATTQGQSIWHYRDAPDRPDYHALTPIPFQHEYDDEQDA